MNLSSKNDIYFEALGPQDIQQQYADTCAIKVQQIILEAHGIEISEEQLVQESIEKGWYDPKQGGTSPLNVGNLLEDHGLKVQRLSGASFDDIIDAIGKGRQVIVGVDSGELWNPSLEEQCEDIFLGSRADHALIVSGISINPLTGKQEITLTDPGTGEIASTYTIEQFNDAWDDSDNFMVITE